MNNHSWQLKVPDASTALLGSSSWLRRTWRRSVRALVELRRETAGKPAHERRSVPRSAPSIILQRSELREAREKNWPFSVNIAESRACRSLRVVLSTL